MKSKKISVLSAVIIAVFVVAFFYFIFGVVSDYKNGSKSSADCFNQITAQTSDLLSKMPATSPQFLPSFINAAAQKTNIASIKLEYQGNTLYQFPDDKFSTTSSLIKTFTTQLQTSEGIVSLSISLYMLPPFSIFSKARVAFFIILIATLFTAILILYEYLSEKTISTAAEAVQKNDFKMPEEKETASLHSFIKQTVPVPESGLAESDLDSIIPETEKAADSYAQADVSENSAQEAAQNANEYIPADPITAEKQPADDSSVEENPIDEVPAEDISESTPQAAEVATNTAEATAEPAATDETEKNDAALFSAETGLCKESYLKTRLESELIRAASAEQDLSLFVIKIPEISFSALYIPAVVKLLHDYFNFKDMIFEFGTNGFAIIKSNENLDSALNISENFHSDLITILRKNNIESTPVIGISSRSLRLIPSERLLTEAEHAADHAAEDTQSPIVAFRVDPERYRKYLSEAAGN